MAVNDFGECALESSNVESSLNTDCERDIVERAARLQLVQEQEPLLGEGYGKGVSLRLHEIKNAD